MPQVPGVTSSNGHTGAPVDEVTMATVTPPEQEKEKSPTSDTEPTPIKADNDNGKSGSSGEEETSCDSGGEIKY